MRAITEIPANTPRPIGRTESFFPGIANPAWEDSVAAAAAAAAAAPSPPDVTALGEDVGGRLPDGVGVPVGVGTDDDGTVETPCKMNKSTHAKLNGSSRICRTWILTFTDTAGFPLAVAVVLVVEGVELVDDDVEDDVNDAAGTVETPYESTNQ